MPHATEEQKQPPIRHSRNVTLYLLMLLTAGTLLGDALGLAARSFVDRGEFGEFPLEAEDSGIQLSRILMLLGLLLGGLAMCLAPPQNPRMFRPAPAPSSTEEEAADKLRP